MQGCRRPCRARRSPWATYALRPRCWMGRGLALKKPSSRPTQTSRWAGSLQQRSLVDLTAALAGNLSGSGEGAACFAPVCSMGRGPCGPSFERTTSLVHEGCKLPVWPPAVHTTRGGVCATCRVWRGTCWIT